MVDMVAPTLEQLVRNLMPWLDDSCFSGSVPSPVSETTPANSLPDTPAEVLSSTAGTKNHPHGHDTRSSGFVPLISKMSSSYPAHSFARSWIFPNSTFPPGYSPDVAVMNFEFGPDYVIIPPDHTIAIVFARDHVLEAYNSDDDVLFRIKSLYALSLQTTSPSFRRTATYVEFGPGTFRIVPSHSTSHNPGTVLVWAPPTFPN